MTTIIVQFLLPEVIQLLVIQLSYVNELLFRKMRVSITLLLVSSSFHYMLNSLRLFCHLYWVNVVKMKNGPNVEVHAEMKNVTAPIQRWCVYKCALVDVSVYLGSSVIRHVNVLITVNTLKRITLARHYKLWTITLIHERCA